MQPTDIRAGYLSGDPANFLSWETISLKVLECSRIDLTSKATEHVFGYFHRIGCSKSSVWCFEARELMHVINELLN
jgi:hypothetical protein